MVAPGARCQRFVQGRVAALAVAADLDIVQACDAVLEQEFGERRITTPSDPLHEGVGLFATRPIVAGDFIDEVEYEREVTLEAPLDPDRGERFEHCAYPDRKVMLVAYPGRHMNHSCDPNAYYVYDGDRATAYARRDIVAGEEVTVDYLINTPRGDSWPCRCGATRCRGETGHSFFDLPTSVQLEYLPLLAPWFVERFRRQMDALPARR